MYRVLWSDARNCVHEVWTENIYRWLRWDGQDDDSGMRVIGIEKIS